MIPHRVSVIVPSRNEPFLTKTVQSLLAHAAADIEVIVVLEGYWDPTLPADPRVKILHHGKAQGMRPAINHAVAMSTGQYLLKTDAHVMWAPGYDAALRADYHEDNWILTPRRYALDADAWLIDRANPKYPIDYEYLSYGLERPDDPTCGFHGTPWTARRDARPDVMLDTDLASQGSAWFQSRTNWDRNGEMRVDLFGSFFGESQEIGLATMLRGGAMMRTKHTWMAHLRKGKTHGRGYQLGPNGHRRGAGLMVRMCMLNEWPRQVKTLQQVLEPFMPVPTWPPDLDRCFGEAKQMLTVAA